MSRSPEQRAADADLAEAITAHAAAYGTRGLLMEWVLTAAWHVPAEDLNDPDSTITATSASPNTPLYRIAGLIRSAAVDLDYDLRPDDAGP